MATKLISTLNSLAHLTPDEIVANLHDSGWVKGSDFNRARYDRWRNRDCIPWYPVRIGTAPEHGACSRRPFIFMYNDEDGGLSGLQDYYFILTEFFTGEYPSC